MNKKGFTLAEVLITLAIIGVVAAVTIPSVIANYQQQEFKTGLRKAVSVLNEAIQANIATEGETPYENQYLGAYLRRHLSYTFANSDTWYIIAGGPTGSVGSNETFYTTDGMRYEIPFAYMAGRGLKLHESGVVIASYKMDLGEWGVNYRPRYGNCGSYGLSKNPHNTTNTPCIIVVDVNGDRKPNPHFVENKMHPGVRDGSYSYVEPNNKRVNDIFSIMITEDRAIPFGVVAQRAMYEK